VGCAASHLFTDLVKIFDSYFGFGGGLSAYPCVVILCTMGAAHVGKCLFRKPHHARASNLVLLYSHNVLHRSHFSSAYGDHAYLDSDDQRL